jgi:iron complex outermembrane recepter protein
VKRTYALAIWMAACIAMAGPAAAQPTEPPPAQAPQPEDPSAPVEPLRLKENVEVTATRSQAATETSPASSTVVLRSDLEKRDIVLVDQALTTVEGVYAYRQRGITDNEVGIGMRGFSGRGAGQGRVLVLLDGMPLNNSYTGAVNWTGIPMSEVDRIEVVRGPFSSLYGGNAMGGVVNVLTRPIERRSAELYTQYGTNDTLHYSGRAGARLFERLGVSVAYESLSTGGYPTQEVLRTATDSTPSGGVPVSGVVRYLTRTGTVNYAVGLRGDNTYDRYNVRARTEYTFAPTTFGSFQYIRQNNNFEWDPYTSWVRTPDGRLLDSGDIVFEDNGVWKRTTLTPSNFLGVVGGGSSNLYQAQILHSTARLGEWRMQAGVLDAPNDRTGTPGTTATLAGGPGSVSLQENRGVFANGQWSRITAKRHTIVAGVDVRADRASVVSFQTPDYISGGASSPRETYAAGEAMTWALYAQDTFAISDTLQLTVGGRYDAWRTHDGESQKATTLPTEPFADRSADALTGKAAVVYRVREGLVIRSSVGTAFRSPSVFDLYRDTRLSSGSLLLGNPLLEPEHMTSWEVGVRHIANRGVAFDAAYYENRIRDLIFRSVDASDPSGLTSRNFNAGNARTRGLELATTLRPTAWLTLRPTYTFTDPLIVENDRSPATVGKQIPFVPRHVAAGTITASVKRLTMTGTGRYQSAVFSSDTNNDTVKHVPGAYDEFFEADLAVNYALARMIVFNVAVENLFDQQYYLFYRNPGRTVMAGLRVRY